MKKNSVHVLICIFIINSFFISNFLIINVQGVYNSIDPEYGNAPIIDGFNNETSNEWGDASKIWVNLYNNLSFIGPGLPIQVWMLQNESDLYICLKFDLEIDYRSYNEFMGLLITERIVDSSDINFTEDVFVDAKIIQFSDIFNGDFKYEDYSISGSTFTKDSSVNGEGAAKLDEQTVVYEFMLPVNSTEDDEDVFLDYGEQYGFEIIYGNGTTFPDDIKKLNVVIVDINYPETTTGPGIWETVRFVLSIIIFSGIGAFLGIYSIKIVLLKKKIERYK